MSDTPPLSAMQPGDRVTVVGIIESKSDDDRTILVRLPSGADIIFYGTDCSDDIVKVERPTWNEVTA